MTICISVHLALPDLDHIIDNEHGGVSMKRTVCFLVICVCMLLGLSSCDGEANPLLIDAEERINIANILSNYELLFEHGYQTSFHANPYDEVIFLYMRGSIDGGRHNGTIIINRTYQIMPDTDIQFTITTSTTRLSYREGILGRTVGYTHRLRVESEAVEIIFLEDTPNRYSQTLFDELNLILDVVSQGDG